MIGGRCAVAPPPHLGWVQPDLRERARSSATRHDVVGPREVPMFAFDTDAITQQANSNPAFLLTARYWTGLVGFDLETDRFELQMEDGKVSRFSTVDRLDGEYNIKLSGPAGAWDKLLEAVPPPRYDHIGTGNQATGFSMEGDMVGAIGPYFAAVQEFIAILREARSGPIPVRSVADVDRAFDSAV